MKKFSLLFLLLSCLFLTACGREKLTIEQIGPPRFMTITNQTTLTSKLNIDSPQFDGFKNLSDEEKIAYTIKYCQKKEFLSLNNISSLDGYQKVRVDSEAIWPRVIFTFSEGKSLTFVFGAHRGGDTRDKGDKGINY